MATRTAQSCPECSGRLQADDCETVCTECGLVVDEHNIDPGPEWRSFAEDETNPERTGAPLTRSRHDRGLSTEIGRSTRLKGRKRRQMARLRRQHKRTQIKSKAERNRVYAFTEIDHVVNALDLPRRSRSRPASSSSPHRERDFCRGGPSRALPRRRCTPPAGRPRCRARSRRSSTLRGRRGQSWTLPTGR